MSEEEKKLFAEINQGGLEIDGMVQCLDVLVFARFPGPNVTMEDINALHGLTAAFKTLSKKHVKDIANLN
ncbi:hypothetical protein [Tetragenococcus halophilus]|uniref:hypothetical protein n=1 Tax=Tetragenococcus halophilus TaxID=51669 RepID=UPI001032159C|nr:hypothetical protein [Tetragenococcus halophilus]MDN6140721.1 hypothetical protein [Tetragenococcus koreensis]MCF1675471.1 hypothetical protein [Tetragenococcus halophilus]MCO7025645.1 hypothetical protein [Tetragenococcus halophilus]MCO8286215.1 hypothetical protein [Tetragenococcus halophilus]MDN6147137.1 hypothetical protein [Tetragenococcus koreensis]